MKHKYFIAMTAALLLSACFNSGSSEHSQSANAQPSNHEIWVQMVSKCKKVSDHYCNVEKNPGQCETWSQAAGMLPANEPPMPPMTETDKGMWLTAKNCSGVYGMLPPGETANGK